MAVLGHSVARPGPTGGRRRRCSPPRCLLPLLWCAPVVDETLATVLQVTTTQRRPRRCPAPAWRRSPATAAADARSLSLQQLRGRRGKLPSPLCLALPLSILMELISHIIDRGGMGPSVASLKRPPPETRGHYVSIALHCRFKTPHHYRILNRHNHNGSDEGKLSLSVPTNRQCSSTSLPVLYTTRQSLVPPTLSVHETTWQSLVPPTLSVCVLTGSVVVTSTAGL